MAHIRYDNTISEYFVSKYPIFLEYCAPISEFVPFFETA